jgi:hypothetical protein
MSVTIREHVRRRAKQSTAILFWAFVLMICLLAIGRNRPWVGPTVGLVFVAMVAGLIWSAWIRCPRCGRWFSRTDLARFTWWFLREPEACPRCGVSLDTAWDQPRVSR